MHVSKQIFRVRKHMTCRIIGYVRRLSAHDCDVNDRRHDLYFMAVKNFVLQRQFETVTVRASNGLRFHD